MGPFAPSWGSAKLSHLFELIQCTQVTSLHRTQPHSLSITDMSRYPPACSPASPELRRDLGMTGPAINRQMPQITALLEEGSAKYEEALSLGRGKPHPHGWGISQVLTHISQFLKHRRHCFSYFGRGTAYALRMHLPDMDVSQVQAKGPAPRLTNPA